jgi:hypothetical protein
MLGPYKLTPLVCHSPIGTTTDLTKYSWQELTFCQLYWINHHYANNLHVTQLDGLLFHIRSKIGMCYTDQSLCPLADAFSI